MYKINLNDKAFELSAEDLANFDLLQEDATHFHVLDKQQAYKIEVLTTDFDNKTIQLKINGNTHTVSIADENDQLVKKLGLLSVVNQKVNAINSPMPGLVLDILVEEGQSVSKGDSILILEAMKMENIIKAPNDAVIKGIKTTKGTAVEKGELLVEMD